MRAYTAKLPTTPGFKLERRGELESMCEQIKYMTANKERQERLNLQEEYEEYSSSDDDDAGPPSFWNSTPKDCETGANKTGEKQRPIEGRIPCYWSTLTTAPFRSSLFPYYINGHHDTPKDVKTRRQLAIENPHIVAFFSALHLELVLKYVMQNLLDLDDFYCVFEWGSGGVLHLHCILWNFESEHLEDFDLERFQVKHRVPSRTIRKIANFFNFNVSEWNPGKNSDGSWKSIPDQDDNSPHPASISKFELDAILPHQPDHDESDKDERLSYIVDLLQIVQQHNIHKPHTLGPPLPSQKCAKKEPEKIVPPGAGFLHSKNKSHYCTKGYPKNMIELDEEEIHQDEHREKLWKLFLERNDQTLNNYNPVISLAILANMDLQPVLTYDGLLAYTTKYVTKDDNPDLFRDFRDDSGKPTDPVNTVHRTEIPQQPGNVFRETTKIFNDQIKYSMVSSPELHHHLLNLPTHYTSRTFLKISLHSELNRLLQPQEVVRETEENEAMFVKEDHLSLYEKRATFDIPQVSRERGITETTIKEMSLFLFHKHVFVRDKKLCRKSKPPIIIFRPYITPKEKNNPKFDQYMTMTLLAFKPFTSKSEITSLSAAELRNQFFQFFYSGDCPFFVIKAFEKANRKRKSKKKTDQQSQDEIEREALNDTSDSEEEPFEKPENEHGVSHDATSKGNAHGPPPLAKFTEAYQEYGHMAPTGLDYEGSDIAQFDDDNDVLEEIKVLSDEQENIFDHTKQQWQPNHPKLIEEAIAAEKTILQQIGVEESRTNLFLSDLDPTQRLFVDTIIDWEKQSILCKKKKQPFPPLRVKLLGVAGTGKSLTIKTLIQEWHRNMEQSDLEPRDHGKIIICAPTGVAAFNIGCGAASIHKTFNIPVKGKFQDLTGDAQQRLETAFEGAWLVVIDEISMVGAETFAKINERLVQAKLDDNQVIANAMGDSSLIRPTFGGLGMIICGDFAQLVPIMQHSLMDPFFMPIHDTSKEKDRFTNKGKQLVADFKVTIILTKQHRQSGGEYTNLCLKLRDGSFSPSDHLQLQSRNYDHIPLEEKLRLEEKGTRLVTTNKQAGKYNAKKLLDVAKSSSGKIFRFNAHETGNQGKAVTTSENFGGLKSTIHLTIGSRVMLTSNLWVEAGLINGAQGHVRDLFFEVDEEGEPSARYILVEFDDFKGPPLFADDTKRNWVPIFPLLRQHQFNPKVQREQFPLRLSSAMTGHKVQGLSLYEGVIVDYPTRHESKKDPMDTWGLNYCILTRVPQLNKIAFINLPDYGRHMKLYNKTKGKNFFKMFLTFNTKSYHEFACFVKHVANISLDTLSTLSTNILFPNNTDFHKLHMSGEKPQTANDQGSRQKNQKPDDQYEPDVDTLPMHKMPEAKRRKQPSKPPQPPKQFEPFHPKQSATSTHVPQYDYTVMTIPRFDNPSNNCWVNAVLQILNQALKCRGDSPDIPNDQVRQDLIPYGDTLMGELRKFQQPGLYSVNNFTDGFPRITLKQLVLLGMGIPSLTELHHQHDAAQCIQAILAMTQSLSFLWHVVQETIRCETCGSSSTSTWTHPVAPVDFSTMIQRNSFDAAGAIKNYFESEEGGIDRRCTDCHGQTCSKSLFMPSPAKFIVVQFKRFTTRQLRNNTVTCKINAEALPFETLDIHTGQGICTYKVIATVHHLGIQLTQGHYVAYVKQGNQWIMCDDQHIIPHGETSSDPVRNAYLLLLQFTEE